MEIRSYQKALDYLDSFITPIVFKKIENPTFDPLERVRKLLSLIVNPQQKFKSIVVSGTSGKSSTSYLISHMLQTAGYKTGLTISPHLQKVNERLQINGKLISDSEFTELTASMIRIIEKMKKMPFGAPSYFEILLAMTFLYFAREKVDIAVVEVGLEGKYDATNVLLPLLIVLTNISLDHTQILGNTVERIAGEAVGAIKKLDPPQIVISGVSQKLVVDIVKKQSEKTNANLFLLGQDFDYKIKKSGLNGEVFDLIIYRGRGKKLNDLRLSLLGNYQVENASLAIKAVLKLERFGFQISEKDIRKALKTAFVPGRFEIVSVISPQFSVVSKQSVSDQFIGLETGKPKTDELESENRQPRADNRIILDGAHNPAKMKAFISNLKKIFPKDKKVFIIAFKFDKDISKILKEITKVADEIIVTEFSVKTDVSIHASYDALKIKNQISSLRQGFGRQAKFKTDTKVFVEKNSKKALEKALTLSNLAMEQLSNGTIIIVTGSLYLVGEIRSML